MPKPELTLKDKFWVQNQLRTRFPKTPSKRNRDEYYEVAFQLALQIANGTSRQDYKGIIDRDDLKFLTLIPRTTINDTVIKMIAKGTTKKVADPVPPRTRGRRRIFYKIQTQS